MLNVRRVDETDALAAAGSCQKCPCYQWDSVDDAVALYRSRGWADLCTEATKIIRRYLVERRKVALFPSPAPLSRKLQR
jgi:hypothetical protein